MSLALKPGAAIVHVCTITCTCKLVYCLGWGREDPLGILISQNKKNVKSALEISFYPSPYTHSCIVCFEMVFGPTEHVVNTHFQASVKEA